jgi:hypothetical protein
MTFLGAYGSNACSAPSARGESPCKPNLPTIRFTFQSSVAWRCPSRTKSRAEDTSSSRGGARSAVDPPSQRGAQYLQRNLRSRPVSFPHRSCPLALPTPLSSTPVFEGICRCPNANGGWGSAHRKRDCQHSHSRHRQAALTTGGDCLLAASLRKGPCRLSPALG